MENPMHKYERVETYIRELIRSRQIGCGEKIPSENELTRRFGLSRCTVRHAIDQLVSAGMLEKRHGSGTFVRASGATERSAGRTVGILITYVDDYIFPSIIRGAETVLTQQRYAISLGITHNKVEKERLCLQSMLERGVDGLLIEGTKSALPNPNLDLLRRFDERRIPVVFLHSGYEAFAASCVRMDDEKSGFLAGDYLIQHGHTRIAAFFKSDDMQGHRRYEGFLRSMHDHGLTVDENAVIWYATEDIPTLFGGESDGALRGRLDGATAVVCYNDQIALQTIHLLERLGLRVPQDVSVVGFDDSDLCRLSSVGLTSVAHAHQAIGRAAAQGLLGLIGGGRPFARRLTPRLVVRESVRDIRPDAVPGPGGK